MMVEGLFFFQAEDGIRDIGVTGVQTCALPIYGSYLRVKDVTLSYDVAKNVLKKLSLTRLMPYVSFSNLLTFTNYSGRDPEVNQHGNSGAVQGLDWGTYPLSRDRKSTRLNSSHANISYAV